MISSAVKPFALTPRSGGGKAAASAPGSLRRAYGSYHRRDARTVLADVGRADHMPLHPLPEAVAVAADLLPGDVEVVVAVVVAVRVGGVRAERGLCDSVDHPARDDDAAGPQLEAVDDLLDGDERPGGGEHRLLLHAADS